MRYRKQRIVWSVFCGLLCLLLIALWVGSYFRCYSIERIHAATMTNIEFDNGFLWISHSTNSLYAQFGSQWNIVATEPSDLRGSVYVNLSSPSRRMLAVQFPIVYLAVIFGALACAPWVNFKRFTVRTLLIATMLIAAALGAIVYSTR